MPRLQYKPSVLWALIRDKKSGIKICLRIETNFKAALISILLWQGC